MLETFRLYASKGHVLDFATSSLLTDLANLCADGWRQPDAGMWELPEERHYTLSKLGCWFALESRRDPGPRGHIPDAMCGRWERERDRIRDWVNEHCWSERKQAIPSMPAPSAWTPACCSVSASASTGVSGR